MSSPVPVFNGTKLRQLRGDRSQLDLAIAAGVQRTVIAKLEIGRSAHPTVGTAYALATALGVTVEDLVVAPDA